MEDSTPRTVLRGFKTHPAPAGNATVGAVPSAVPTGGAADTAGGSGRAGGSGTRTVTGDVIDTRWGPVQVRVTLIGHRITKVETVQVPDGNPRDQEINGFAVPQLLQETLSAQNARIDAVSGATVTREGHIRSPQSALDRAGR